MGIYSRIIFPRIYDCFMDRPLLTPYRRQQLAEVQGSVLEIGVGTGLNLPHYPSTLSKLVTVDPNTGMNRRLQRRVGEVKMVVEPHVLRGEEMPFAADSFDFVVSTLTLCSIAEVEKAIGEVHRVLKPGDRFVFFEHGLSEVPRVQRRQRLINPLQRLLGDGCRLDLRIDDLVMGHSFAAVEVERFQLEQTPPTLGAIYRGWAVK